PTQRQNLHSFATRRSSDLQENSEDSEEVVFLVHPLLDLVEVVFHRFFVVDRLGLGVLELVDAAVKVQVTDHLRVAFIGGQVGAEDRKSTRLNSSHVKISYA